MKGFKLSAVAMIMLLFFSSVQVSSAEKLMTFVQVALGSNHSIALDQSGNVWAWGNNEYGQLGIGTRTERDPDTNLPDKNDYILSPIQVKGINNVKAIAGASNYSLALKNDGSVWIWGGVSPAIPADASSLLPKQVEGLSNIKAITGGADHFIALKDDGTVWAWGDNFYGQIDLSGNQISSPIQIKGLNQIVEISAGASHSLALKKDGTVWAWGGNYSGQIGNGETNAKETVTQISSLKNVSHIAAGGYHSLALLEDGSVWEWGANGNRTPARLNGLKDITSISGGYLHSLALTENGEVWSWEPRTSMPVKISGLNNIISIAGNSPEIGEGRYTHSIALKDDGSIWTWGMNPYGQLGDGTTTKREIPVRVVFSEQMKSTDTPAKTKLAFKDLSSDHWAYSNIQWAYERNIISGYDDKTVRPNDLVTEAEFLAFLQRAFPNPAQESGMNNQSIWYEKYYEFAEILNLPVNKTNANKPINRGQVAHIVVSGLGFNYDVEQSVNYLLNNGFSKGKTSSTYEGYEPFSNLTRAEAVTFINNMVDKGITKLEKRPVSSSASNSDFRTYTNNRFGFTIDFPNNWPKETLSQNGDGATVEGPQNGESGEFAAPEYSFSVSASHYFEDFVNENYPWVLNANGRYGYDTFETITLNDGRKAKIRITGDGFPTVITAVIIQDDMMFKMEGTNGSVDNYDKTNDTLLDVMRSFRILKNGEERGTTTIGGTKEKEPLNYVMSNYVISFEDGITDSRPFLKDELVKHLLRLTYNPKTTIVISDKDFNASLYNLSTVYDGKLSLLYMNNAVLYDVENLFKPYYQGIMSSDDAMKFDESPQRNVPEFTLDMGLYTSTEENIAKAAFSKWEDPKAEIGLSFIELHQQVYKMFYDDVMANRIDSTLFLNKLIALEKVYYQFFSMNYDEESIRNMVEIQ